MQSLVGLKACLLPLSWTCKVYACSFAREGVRDRYNQAHMYKLQTCPSSYLLAAQAHGIKFCADLCVRCRNKGEDAKLVRVTRQTDVSTVEGTLCTICWDLLLTLHSLREQQIYRILPAVPQHTATTQAPMGTHKTAQACR